jgi:hypothetical protein
VTVGKHETTVVIKGESSGASKAVDDLSKRLEKLEKKLDKTTSKGKKMGSALEGQGAYQKADAQFQRLTASVNTLKAGLIGAAVVGAAKLAAKTWELAKAQHQLDGIYRNLNFSVEAASFATEGLIAKSDLARSAAQAQALGVANSAEEFATLARSVQLAASAQGVDFARALEQVTQGIGKQSSARLDDIGIVVKAGDAQRKYAAALGVTVNELSAEQKQAAFAEEAMRKLAKMAGEAAPLQKDMVTALVQTGVGVEDMLQQFAGGGNTGGSAENFFRQLANGARAASQDFGTMEEALKGGSEAQRAIVREFMEFKTLAAAAATDTEKLKQLNVQLWSLGVEQVEDQERLGHWSRVILNNAEDKHFLEQLGLRDEKERLRIAEERATDAENEVAFAESANAASLHAINMARAQGKTEKDILILQQEQVRAQFAIAEAKVLTGDITDEAYESEREKAIKQLQVLEALIAKTKTRGRVGRRASKDIVKGLIEEAKIGEEAAQSREVRAEFDRFLFDEETGHARARLAQNEELQLQREREADFIMGDGLVAMQQRINKENELLSLQIEAAALAEEMAFTDEERQTAADAREQLLHEQKVKRKRDEMEIEKQLKAEREKSIQDQLNRSTAILGIQKNFIQGFGQIAVEGAKQRGASERAVFNAEKGIKSASLALDAITYGAKASAAFASGNFIGGAGFTVAAGIATAAAIQTLALTPDSARGEAGATGGGASAQTQAPDRGGTEAPSSQIPGSAADGRGATLPNGAGPNAAGGGVSVNIGTFQTLGTVDDETGTKLAQAIDRVKADGLT